MRSYLLLIVSMGLLAMTGRAFAGEQWKLVWADEFDTPGLPDPAKWVYEEGFVRNHEAQYYTKGRLENARVEDGHLIMECRKEEFKNAKYEAGSDDWRKSEPTAHYTSAALETQGLASWTYGRFEMRAKLPQGKGVWPAFWMLGDIRKQVGWPRCGEIDIMEFVGKEPGKVHGTLHWADAKGKHKSSGGAIKTDKPLDDFHMYAVEWYPDRMDFYFDDVKYRSFKLDAADVGEDNAFRKPQFILLNFALGGSWGGKIDDANLPQQFVVDYVRVYQQAKTGEQ